MINEGSLDRIIRVLVGVVALSLVFFGPHSLWGLLGLAPLVTGIFGYCPLYKAIGVDTCEMRRGRHAA